MDSRKARNREEQEEEEEKRAKEGGMRERGRQEERQREEDELLFHCIPLIQPSSQHITDKAHTDSSPQCVCKRVHECVSLHA